MYDLLYAGAFQMLFSLNDLLLSRGKPVLNEVRIQKKKSQKIIPWITWEHGEPGVVSVCTWSVPVHTISSYVIINLIFLKVFARHTHLEYTEIHTYIVCIIHICRLHIYTYTQTHREHFSDLNQVTFVNCSYFDIYYLQVTFI